VQSWTHANSLVGDVDYVNHHDIIPFAPSESVGFRNGLYSMYFRRRSALASQLVASSLSSWFCRAHSDLPLQ
jgi:hypothetical protein